MGMMKFLARAGAVGGTARWAADNYRFFRQRHPASPEWPDEVIFRLMIVNRFRVLPNKAQEEYLLQIENIAKNGLMGLVVELLRVESGWDNNTAEYQATFLSVIREELEKKGLSFAQIHGE